MPHGITINGIAKFWSKVNRGEADDCWEWQGSRTGRGYGTIRLGGKSYGAHRLAWEIAHGELPKELCVCHRCDNPPCCNPAHLFAGTYRDNSQDALAKGRLNITSLPVLRGNRSPNAKLTEAQVRMIRRSPEPAKTISVAYGVSHQTIYLIRNRRIWQHVA